MFGRKDKKKFARQWMLDVKGRSGPLRALRLKMAAGALAISTGVVLVLMVAWKGGEYALERFVYSNPAFGIEQLEIQSTGIIPLEQIRAWANIRVGDNLPGLDLVRVKRDLELVPLIESVSVERVLPRKLIIRVHEREPIARMITFSPRPTDGLLQPSATYLDEQGMVIPPVLRSLNSAAFDSATRFLPTITGFSGYTLRPGHKMEAANLLAALRWIRVFQDSEMAGHVNIRSLDLSSQTALLIATEQGSEVSFPLHDFGPALARWRRVHDFGLLNQLSIASLDLVVTNYLPAYWVALTNGPPPVRPDEPSPYKKRHV